MKKIGFAFFTLLALVFIYYFTSGSAQITKEIKAQVNSEILNLSQNGFAIEERIVKKREEHFVISFKDEKQIIDFFKKKGASLNQKDAALLIGMKIGVDLKYLNDTYSALSMDIYPIALPHSISQSNMRTKEDKLLLAHLNDMLTRKAVLIHIDFNKLLSSFKGYLKDIHETINSDKAASLTLQGTTFKGTIEKDKIKTLTQNVKRISFEVQNELLVQMETILSTYASTGTSIYDSTAKHQVQNLRITGISKHTQFSISCDNIDTQATTKIQNNLVQSHMQSSTQKITFRSNNEENTLQDIHFNFNIHNLDMDTLQSLDSQTTSNPEERKQLLQTLFSKGIHMSISPFSAKTLEINGKKMDGFTLESNLEISKATQIANLKANPFELLNIINSKTRVTLSPELLTLISKNPKAMLLLMVLKPQSINGKQVFEVELKDGKITVNGQKML